MSELKELANLNLVGLQNLAIEFKNYQILCLYHLVNN